jgi:hypothetical protein
MIGDLTLLLLLAASPALPATPTEAACAGNGRTSLQLRTGPAAWPAHHDGPSGATTFLLRAVPGGELLHTERRGGRWRCLGAATTPRGYLAGGVLQRGGWLPLASVVYLPEAGGPAVPSSFDRAGYLALAALASPGGRFLAFVGGRGVVDGLYVLDVARDEVRRLGPAPAPPPDPGLRTSCGDEPFDWGGCWADGLVDLEPSVLRFLSEDVLEATTGKDGPGGRARERAVRRYELGRRDGGQVPAGAASPGGR